jgi:hypothetical protein
MMPQINKNNRIIISFYYFSNDSSKKQVEGIEEVDLTEVYKNMWP